jgi:subtilase-type serine protease
MAALTFCASAALAQSTTPAKDDPAAKTPTATSSMPRTKPMRKPVVDLEKMAKDRRPGQVMPGDPTPVAQPMVAGAGMLPESTPATPPPQRGVIQLPDTSPAMKADLKPSAEAPMTPAPASADPMTPNATPSAMTASDIQPTPSPMSTTPTPAMPTSTTPTPAPVMNETPMSAAPTPAPVLVETAMPSTPAPAAPMAEAATPASAAPMVEVAAPTPAIEATPIHSEPLPQVDAAPTKAEPISTKPDMMPAKADQTDSMIGGVGLVDKYIITSMPMAMSTGPAKIRVESLKGDSTGIQWRASGESSWKTPAVGDSVEARAEIRAGLDSEMVVVVDDRVQVRIGRLGRAVIERTEEAGATTAMSITLSRGAVELRPWGTAQSSSGQMFARVKTPDQVFGLTGPLRVEYDAFTGTRRRTLNP